jgi:purine-nucleoside phosphorylase
VLGSGFQNVTSRVRMAAESSYQELPGFHAATVLGHAGRLILGHLRKTPVLVLSGRLHYYEGHSMDAVTFPIRVLAEFGIQDILLTNAAGGINPLFHIGVRRFIANLRPKTESIDCCGSQENQAAVARGSLPGGLGTLL